MGAERDGDAAPARAGRRAGRCRRRRRSARRPRRTGTSRQRLDRRRPRRAGGRRVPPMPDDPVEHHVGPGRDRRGVVGDHPATGRPQRGQPGRRGCARAEQPRGRRRRPRRARSAPAYRASPPLSPEPTSSSTRAPYTPAEEVRDGVRETGGRALHQRALGEPGHQVGLGRAHLLDRVRAPHAATLAPGVVRPRPPHREAWHARPGSVLEDDHGRGDPGVVGQRHVDRAGAEVVGPGQHRAADLQLRVAATPR